MIQGGTIQKMMQAKTTVQKTSESRILKREIVSRKKLKGDNMYAFCPECYASGAASLNKPDGAVFLIVERVAYRLADDSVKVYNEEYYHCPICSKNLTVADFVKKYARPLGYNAKE